MPRADLSDHLVHFTSGASWDEAFGLLCAIVEQARLKGSNRLVRGGYRCVCFSEAPLPLVPGGLVNPDAYSRYAPFGVMIDKSWLFSRGGRPVIYQPDAEFNELPESLGWRHVRFDLNERPPVDFTWEREWRVQVDELDFDPSCAVVVLPDGHWSERFRQAFDERQDWQVAEYAQVLDQQIAEAYRESCPWRITTLQP